MRENELTPSPGSGKPRKRVGRGYGSGHGGYAGRGTKGQKSRTGGGVPPYFEGGQLPLVRRLPRRRGFKNPFRQEFQEVNLKDLARVPGEEITPEGLKASGLIKSLRQPVKVLGDGEIDRPITVRAHRFSGPARAKIEKAGGKAEEIPLELAPVSREDPGG